MNISMKKFVACNLVALTAAATFVIAPAQAKIPFPIPKPIPLPKPIPKPVPKGGWPHHHHGFGWGAAGLVGGLALGAMAASAASDYYSCSTVRQAVVDEYGVIVGYRYVQAC